MDNVILVTDSNGTAHPAVVQSHNPNHSLMVLIQDFQDGLKVVTLTWDATTNKFATLPDEYDRIYECATVPTFGFVKSNILDFRAAQINIKKRK